MKKIGSLMTVSASSEKPLNMIIRIPKNIAPM